MSEARFYLSADVAAASRAAGLSMRTAAAVRAAVREGRLEPAGYTPNGVAVWDRERLVGSLQAMATAKHLRERATGYLRRLGGSGEPIQRELRIGRSEEGE